MRTRNVLFWLSTVVLSLSGVVTAQQVIATVPVGGLFSWALAVDSVTNKIYVAIANNDLMTVIDGTTLATTNVTIGSNPPAIAVNPVTNKIYVSSGALATLTVVDGVTLQTATIPVGRYPESVVVNTVTNKIYTGNENSVTVIDGATNETVTIPLTDSVLAMVLDQGRNKIYAALGGSTVAIDGNTLAITTIPVPGTLLAINTTLNEIYAVDSYNSLMAIIDGQTLNTITIPTGLNPVDVESNPATAMIYTANADNTVTVINRTTLTESTIPVGQFPAVIAIDTLRNKIYVGNENDNTVTVIDGATNSTVSLVVGASPAHIAVDESTNRIYVSNFTGGTVSVIAGPALVPLQFVPVTPCRLVDTRQTQNPIQGGTSQNFILPQLGGCNIPTSAAAYALNATVVPRGYLGYLTVWPTGQVQPGVSTMNSLDGRVKANAAIVSGGYQGAISVYASNTTDVILDVNGYFANPGPQTYQFYPLTPCRIVDTRQTDFPQGLGAPYLSGGARRDLPVLASPCMPQNVDITAYSLNFTAIPHPAGQQLGYLTTWPQGDSKPTVSTLNNPTATFVANAAIVPAGTGGGISVYPDQNTDLAVDINGYFAAPGQNALSFYPTAPCRVIDTRHVGNGQAFTGEKTVEVTGSICAPPSQAQAYVFNATVIPSPSLSYLTLWPDG